jgi:peptide chain release factor 2
MRERKRLEGQLAMENELVRRTGDIDAYFELAREGESVEPDLEREIKSLSQFVEELESRTMLSAETDPLNAIVTVHPGAGGTESQDWAEMLMRMYLRWAERHGFKTEMNDYQDGEEAGIKSATFTVTGEYAFGQLSGETGPSADTPPLPASLSRPRSMTRSKSTSKSRICASIPIAPAARAGSTSTPRTPPSA